MMEAIIILVHIFISDNVIQVIKMLVLLKFYD